MAHKGIAHQYASHVYGSSGIFLHMAVSPLYRVGTISFSRYERTASGSFEVNMLMPDCDRQTKYSIRVPCGPLFENSIN